MNADLFPSAWTVTYNILSGNVTDPISRNKKWIFSANPMIGSPTDPSLRFPIIIIDPYTLQKANTSTMGRGNVDTSIGTTIEVHDSTAGSRFDAVFGTIFKTLFDNRHSFTNSGLTHMTLTNGDYNEIAISRSNRIHIRSLGLGFDNVTS
jgi:hypothetical protein